MKKILSILAVLSLLASDLLFSQCVNVLYTGSPTFSNQTSNNYYGYIINSTNCGGLATGNYYMNRWYIEFTVYGDFSNATIDVQENLSTGWDGTLEGQNQCSWGGVWQITSTSATFYTYVFEIRNSNYGYVGWKPSVISNARVAYKICKTIPQIVFASDMPKDNYGVYQLARNTDGYLWPANRTNVNCYQWCLKLCNPTANCEVLQFNFGGVKSITPNNGYQFGLRNENYTGLPCPGDLVAPQGFVLYEQLTMGNQGGCTQNTAISNKIQPLTTQIGGCPWIWVQNDSQLVPENNALYKSEFTENYGNDITDLYLLKTKPYLDSNNNISIQFTESINDYTLFDQIKLYSVDHPVGTKVSITENGDIVTYYINEIGSTDDATLNSSRSITPLIQYGYNGEKIVKGVSSDSIYAHFDSSFQNKAKKLLLSRKLSNDGGLQIDSMALIGSLGHNPDYDYIRYPVVKDWAGNVTIYSGVNNITKQFAKRERSSEVIIPFGGLGDVVDYINVVFANVYEVTYFSVVPISYYGFTKTSLNLVSAEHNIAGDISSLLTNKDNDYAYLDSTCVISLKFQDNSTPVQGDVRDYIIQFDGHYTIPGRDNRILGKLNESQNATNNNLTFKFKLNNNYPNPFNPVTSIKYSIPKDANTTLKVYDAIGRLVTTLVNEYQTIGEYEVNFNGENYPSGVYFYKLESGDFVSTKKMVLVK